MTPEHKKFMDESRVYYATLLRTNAVRNMNMAGLVHIMRTYFEPDLHFDMHSAPDVLPFLKRLYAHYDAYLASPPPRPGFRPGQNIYIDREFNKP